MDTTIRSACWYASMEMSGWLVDWSTGAVRRPKSGDAG